MLCLIPKLKSLRLEEIGIEQRGLALSFAAKEPPHERDRERRPRDEQRGDGLTAFLPCQDPENEKGHGPDREDRPDDVDAPVARVGHLADQSRTGQDTGDDHGLEQEADTP